MTLTEAAARLIEIRESCEEYYNMPYADEYRQDKLAIDFIINYIIKLEKENERLKREVDVLRNDRKKLYKSAVRGIVRIHEGSETPGEPLHILSS